MDHSGETSLGLESALDRARDDLASLDGRHIVLTGGTGFVGTWLLELVTRASDDLAIAPRVLVASRRAARFARVRPHLAQHRIVELLAHDVRDGPPATGPVDLVVAAAASPLVPGDDASETEMRATADAGARLVRALVERDGCRALYLSSGAASAVPPDAYGRAKLDAEAQLGAGSAGSAPVAVVARLYTFVGPYLPLDGPFAVGNFLRDALASRTLEVRGDGTQVRSYLYAADLAWWCWSLAVRGVPGTRYDVGSPDPVTIADLARSVARLATPPSKVVVHGRPTASSAPSAYLPDLTTSRALGLAPTVDLDDALSRTFRWHRRAR